MRTFINLTVYILILTGLYSCNSDVFVDDFRTADTELSLDGNGDTAIIKFASSNWDYLSLYIYDDSFTDKLQIYDEHNNLIIEEPYPYMKGLGKIVCNEKLTDFIIERSNPKELKITVGENARPYPISLVLIANNEYESQEIIVDILPSDRYVIDHITYSLNPYSEWRTSDIISIFWLNNDTAEPRTYKLSPYENISYEVMFRSDNPETFQLLGKDNLTVDIPSVENERLVMNGMQAQFNSVHQKHPFSSVEQKEITIPSMTSQEVYLLIDFLWFETEYEIHAVHPKTKNKRIIKGYLQGKMPISYHYLKPRNSND